MAGYCQVLSESTRRMSPSLEPQMSQMVRYNWKWFSRPACFKNDNVGLSERSRRAGCHIVALFDVDWTVKAAQVSGAPVPASRLAFLA